MATNLIFNGFTLCPIIFKNTYGLIPSDCTLPKVDYKLINIPGTKGSVPRIMSQEQAENTRLSFTFEMYCFFTSNAAAWSFYNELLDFQNDESNFTGTLSFAYPADGVAQSYADMHMDIEVTNFYEFTPQYTSPSYNCYWYLRAKFYKFADV